MTQLYAVTGW